MHKYKVKHYREAQRIIACDSTPLIFAGFKLHNATTNLFSNCSRGMSFANPLTTVRGPFASPKSTFDTYKLSASGC